MNEKMMAEMLGELGAYRQMIKLLVGLNQVALSACEEKLRDPLLNEFLLKISSARENLVHSAPPELAPELQSAMNNAVYREYSELCTKVSHDLKEFFGQK